jgi:hypothetical protein
MELNSRGRSISPSERFIPSGIMWQMEIFFVIEIPKPLSVRPVTDWGFD